MGEADILDLWRAKGHRSYAGELLTQLEHAWQCGQLALRAKADASLQLAAWLHDLGHLISPLDGSPTLQGTDDAHEQLGARALTDLFGPAVGMPVALHVAAKRYLVATHQSYEAALSEDSVRSLALQGGPMTDDECKAFLRNEYCRQALRLRIWDDQAKRPGGGPAGTEAALTELSALMAAVADVRRRRPHRSA